MFPVNASTGGISAPRKNSVTVATGTALPCGCGVVRARLAAMAYEGIGSTPAEFAAHYRQEIAKFTQVIADAKIPKQ